MKNLSRSTLSVILAVVFLSSSQATAQSFQGLGDLPPGEEDFFGSRALGLSGDGAVAIGRSQTYIGSIFMGDTTVRAFHWTRSGLGSKPSSPNWRKRILTPRSR